MSPPPIASPGHPVPADGDSGVRQLTERDYRLRMEALEQRIALEKAVAEGKAKAEAFAARLWKIGGAAVLLILGTVGAVAWGQSKIDGGVAPVKEELAHFKTETGGRFDRVDRQFERFDKKLDLLLDERRVPQWKRPPPEPAFDGGQ